MNNRHLTVLVVDDEAPLRRVLDRALTRAGYRVLLAPGPEEAYALLNTEHPDALLLDIHMPSMSGLALYIAIVNRWPALEGCIAIMTGDAEADEVRTWLEHHRCAVIRKPFDLAQVTNWLEDIARFRRRHAGNGSA
ncbi:MAG: response regulator [Gemmatimonadetes bacterium]|nr:response regulator [Gemmatimonadota bacterium]